MDSLVAHGVDAIFGNPGTTENPLLDSLIDYPQIPYYVALHEGVAVGAASFYAQATGKTGIVNLHVAPGLGNGIGMIYGALKARSPMIVTAGQQDTRLRLNEPLLSHDLVAMAAPVTKWSAEPRSADEIGPMMHRAFKIANDPPTGPVFIALPVNVMEQATEIAAVASTALRREAAASEQGITDVVDLLLASDAPAIVVGDDVARGGAVDRLVELAELTGAPVWHEALRAQVSFPNRHPNNQGRIPFETANVNRTLAPHDVVVLIGGNFFEELWYDAGPIISEATQVVQIEASHERLAFSHRLDIGLVADLARALTQLTKALSDKATDTFRAGAKARNDAFTKERDKAREASNARLQSLGAPGGSAGRGSADCRPPSWSDRGRDGRLPGSPRPGAPPRNRRCRATARRRHAHRARPARRRRHWCQGRCRASGRPRPGEPAPCAAGRTVRNARRRARNGPSG